MNKETIETISIITDNIFNAFYIQTNRMIKCYYLSMILVGIDTYSLIIAFAQIKKGTNYLTQIPLMFNWTSSIVCLTVYLVRAKRMKRSIRNNIIDNKSKFKGLVNEVKIKDLTTKLQLRTKSRKPVAFQQAAIAFIIFYFPILVKLCLITTGSFKQAFYASSSMIFIYLFLSTLVVIIIKKVKHKDTKLVQYERLMGNDASYKEKMKLIQNEAK